ncbi:MAG: prephenate dehydrogenase/arogenate dehydrogenase family protein [Candidatus Margulisbacteria bacterium]|nr:prephenate dehydrogenase/arogenate dehydrogenase family protein [Candidatus Margulisiibacteriota bacterium]
MKITVVGMGLIGSSLAWQLRNKGIYVKGYARKKETIAQAYKYKLIDEGSTDLKTAVKSVDLIIIALPIEIIPEYIQKIDTFLNKKTLVIDVASVKLFIVDQVKSMQLKKVMFVGAHPMAGSEKTGIANYVKNLFEDKAFIVTYINIKDKKLFEPVLRKLTGLLKARYMVLSAEEHDRTIATISHLPYVVACSLYNRYLQEEDLNRVASTGFRDTTRIAHSDPYWGLLVTLLNKDNLVNGIDEHITQLKKIKTNLKKINIEEIFDFLNIDGIKGDRKKLQLVKKQITDYYKLLKRASN